MVSEFPSTVLETETAVQLGLLIRSAAYQLEVTPRPNGADLAAGREGTVWATFHVDVDPRRPVFLRVGATVWGGARTNFADDLTWDAKATPRLAAFVKDRLALACKRGRAEDPEHCRDCPEPSHRP